MGKLGQILNQEELFLPGHRACPGCGMALNLRFVARALGKNIHLTIPASCTTIVTGKWPCSAFLAPVELELFASSAAFASGVRAGLRKLGRNDVKVVVWAGDGATYDIGFAAFSSAAARGEDMIYILNDNQAYMNTGVQYSGATPRGAWTTTTPSGAERFPKDIDLIMVEHPGVQYIATLVWTPITTTDFLRKIEKAKNTLGFRFLHILSACPPGWKFPVSQTVRISQLAIETKAFPLVEYEKGQWRITYRPRKNIPVAEYLKLQERFSNLTPQDILAIQELVNYRWQRFEQLSQQ